jgi:hypothetical protein
VTDLSPADRELLRILQLNNGSVILRAFTNKATYSHLIAKGYVIETHLAHGDVHVTLTDSGRKVVSQLAN